MPDNRKPLIYGAFPVCRNYTVRAHFRDDGAPKRRGCKNGVLHAGPLLRGLHAGHLCPRHHRRTAQGGANHGEHPLPCCLMLSAARSRWGQRLGQKKAAGENKNLCKQKDPKPYGFGSFCLMTIKKIFLRFRQVIPNAHAVNCSRTSRPPMKTTDISSLDSTTTFSMICRTIWSSYSIG